MMRACKLLWLAASAAGFAPPRRQHLSPLVLLHSDTPFSQRGYAERPRRGGGTRGRGGGRGGRGRGGRGRGGPEPRAGDWLCKQCNANNFAFRKTCFQCGAEGPKRPPRPNRRRHNWSWAEATTQHGPKEVVAGLAKDLPWVSGAGGDKDAAAYALDDGNFGAPGFNPKTKAVTACQPEVYQAEGEEEGA